MELTKLLFLLVQLISVIPNISAQFEFRNSRCGDLTYSSPSAFQTNLNKALKSMSSDTQITYGYYNFSAGKKPNRVEAMALCRADIAVDDCRSCVRSAVATLPSFCANKRQAVGYSDDCLLYFSNSSVFHVLTPEPFYALAFNGNTSYPHFNILFNLMTALQKIASLGSSEIKFATGKANTFGSNKFIYGLVQCSPDLSRSDCVNCVQYLMDNTFPTYFISSANGSFIVVKGGRVVSPSCNLRFESYPFYGKEFYAVQPPVQPPFSAQGNRRPQFFNSAKARKSSKSHKIILITVPVSGLILLVLVIASFCIFPKKKKQKKFSNKLNKEDINALQSLQFSIGVMKAATKNFADDYKIGKGGFATVYKGKLNDGQDIAVKRFHKGPVSGDIQFKNEILTLAKLHHENLVRLFGFCLEDEEMLLVYEFVINKSLDNFLFDPIHRAAMNWETRKKIINGIVKGLLYLHKESRLRIIHRDLKAANVLLDADFNAKIADFGTAKLFKIDQSQIVTSKIIGTLGYMPPEYLLQGQVSFKSDVFSFGVLILEIISGQRISSFQIGESDENLLTFAWKSRLEGNSWSLVDPSLSLASSAEILRCIHIGLLCVQNNMADRPTMHSVFLMLSTFSIELQEPSQPAFFAESPMLLDVASQGNTSAHTGESYSINEFTVTEEVPR